MESDLVCGHSARAECWLCSDAQPWWREAREKAGLGAEPLNIQPSVLSAVLDAEESLGDLSSEAGGPVVMFVSPGQAKQIRRLISVPKPGEDPPRRPAGKAYEELKAEHLRRRKEFNS